MSLAKTRFHKNPSLSESEDYSTCDRVVVFLSIAWLYLLTVVHMKAPWYHATRACIHNPNSNF